MAGGKIKGISKKEGGDIKKFEWGQRRGRGLFGLLNFLRSGRMSAPEKGRELTDRAELNIKLSKMRRKQAHGSAF